MDYNITVPELFDSMKEGKLVEWKIKVGDRVKKGDVVAEIETNKTVMDIQIFKDGIVKELKLKENDEVKVKCVIAVLEVNMKNKNIYKEESKKLEANEIKEGGVLGILFDDEKIKQNKLSTFLSKKEILYDVICIGGGLNYAGAIVLAKAGKKVALIDENLNELGGVCLHKGCIPSKNLLHRTKILSEIKEDVFRVHKDPLILEKLQDKINLHIKNSTDAITAQCKSMGVKLIEGKAYVIDSEKVQIKDNILKTKHVIIGTGSSVFIPKEIEIDYKKIITSTEALKLTKLPKEIAIYGSGAIGLEFASFFSLNGVKTFLLYRHENISKRFNPKIVIKIENQLKENGITLLPNSILNGAKVIDDKVVINFQNSKELKVDMMLMATGRKANTDVIKTDKIKVERKIVTNDQFETTLKNVFAIGDCNGKLQLAHAARAEALNVAENILGIKRVLNIDNIPKFIYTLPLSYAVIGTKSYKEISFPISHLGISGAVEGSQNGEIFLYLDEDNFITGAELFSPYAEEMIGIFSTAIAGEMDVKMLKKAVFPHPTFSESIDRVLRKIR